MFEGHVPKGVEVQVLSGAPSSGKCTEGAWGPPITLHEPARIEPEIAEKLELTAAEAAGA